MEKNRIPKYIAIEGPIGVGKTSLAKQISQEFGHELCLEKPDENPFLNSFYENTQKYLLPLKCILSCKDRSK